LYKPLTPPLKKTYNMRVLSTIVLAAATAGLATAGEAPMVTDNPVGVTYKATLDGDVQGSITATSGIDGYGVIFKVAFEDLPEDEGPFGYHLHAKAVPEDGNCTGTAAHLNPYNATTTCDLTKLSECEVGDLSGKHGKANGTDFEVSYVDLFASLNPKDPGFFGSLSFVIHRNDSSRLACANFELVPTPAGNCSASHPHTTTSLPMSTSSTVPPAASTLPANGVPSPSATLPPGSSATRPSTSALALLLAAGLAVWVM
jgi:hypothetical protein